MSEWQPIKTAPMDGTVVDVYDPYYRRQIDVSFSHHNWLNGVAISKKTWGNSKNSDLNPTHWIPAPQPPTEIK